MFNGASNFADGVDKAFLFIFSVALFFIVAITAFMIYVVIAHRRREGRVAKQFHGSTKLEIIWTVIPIIIVLIMFGFGVKGYKPMRKNIPEDAMRIKVIGKMWRWDFDYGDGKITDTLYVPVNKAVVLDLYSPDVNHSFYVPAFRVKEDVVPGYDNYMWFIATKTGKFDVYCAEYCGNLHYGMTAKIKVVEQEEYDAWFGTLVSMDNIEIPEGLKVLQKNACTACHSLDGSNLVGPSYLGITDTKNIVIKGSEQSQDFTLEYLIQSIYNPDEELVSGYKGGQMKSYEDKITENEIQQIFDYLLDLNGMEESPEEEDV